MKIPNNVILHRWSGKILEAPSSWGCINEICSISYWIMEYYDGLIENYPDWLVPKLEDLPRWWLYCTSLQLKCEFNLYNRYDLGEMHSWVITNLTGKWYSCNTGIFFELESDVIAFKIWFDNRYNGIVARIYLSQHHTPS